MKLKEVLNSIKILLSGEELTNEEAVQTAEVVKETIEETVIELEIKS